MEQLTFLILELS